MKSHELWFTKHVNGTILRQAQDDRHGVMVTVYKKTPQVGTKLALSQHQVEILRKCLIEAGITELMTIAGRTDRTKFRHQVLNPIIEAGLLEMTIPDKPTSSKQRYRLTDEGRKILENFNK